ncbi:MAG TPA: periplasmic heavy metal sensor [Pyrinomonadaceae bacterium]|nr:periplasmic heavy metal sensor [Pyrinomonadaceae bacterium]
MNNIAKNRWQVRVAAGLIFVLGFLSGILALNVYRAWARNSMTPGDRFEQMSQKLQLNEDQKAKVKQIFNDTREQLRSLRQESEPKVNDIRKQADDRLVQVLTPEQWKKFQLLRDENRQRRTRRPRNDDN